MQRIVLQLRRFPWLHWRKASTLDVQNNDAIPSGVRLSTEQSECVLKAVIIGAPNAGKSTLINNLIGQKVLAVSPKVHTTQQNAIGIFTKDNCQVILLDTPGLIPYQYGRKLNMSKEFLTGAQRSAEIAQMIIVIVDASNKRTQLNLDKEILDILQSYPFTPSILVLNKVDAMKHKHTLLKIVDTLTDTSKQNQKLIPARSSVMNKTVSLNYESCDNRSVKKKYSPVSSCWNGFSNVFMISALTGDGLDALKDYLVSSCQPSPWEYNVDHITDQSPETIVENIIREKLFCYLDKEIPYIIQQTTSLWELNNGILSILINLDCKKSSQVSIVIGPGGKTIQAITSDVKADLESILQCSVDLTLNVRTHK